MNRQVLGWLVSTIARGGDEGFVELRAIDGPRVRQMFIPALERERIVASAERLVEESALACIAPVVRVRQRGTNADALRGNVLWADLDDGRAALDRFPIPPQLLIQTRPGRFHAYWALCEPIDLRDTPERDAFRGALKALQEAVGSDDVHDLARASASLRD